MKRERKECFRTTIYLEKELHRLSKVYCAKNATTLTRVVKAHLATIVADEMKAIKAEEMKKDRFGSLL